MQTSAYQSFKIWLAGVVPVDRDILHIVLGAVILLVVMYVLRGRHPAVGVALMLAAIAGVLMEALDLRDTMAAGQMFDWRHSFGDVLRTISVPSLAYAVICFRRWVSRSQTSD